MTSRLPIPKISKANEMSGIKGLVGKRLDKEVSFMGQKIKIHKLSVADVIQVQVMAKTVQQEAEDETSKEKKGFELLKHVIRCSAEGGADLDDEDFEKLPLEDLSRLSSEIMKFSGLSDEKGK
jgi:hypothetical protein